MEAEDKTEQNRRLLTPYIVALPNLSPDNSGTGATVTAFACGILISRDAAPYHQG